MAKKTKESSSVMARMSKLAKQSKLDLTTSQQRRILWGTYAVDAGADHDEPQSMLVDTLANLMHFAAFSKQHPTTDWEDPQPVDFDEALRIARDHFDVEQSGEED
jgi:hypothetical protein